MENLWQNYTQKFTASVQYIPVRGPITIHQKVFFLIGIAAIVVYVSRLLKSFRKTGRESNKAAEKPEENGSSSSISISIKNEAAPQTPPQPPKPRHPAVTHDIALRHVCMVFLVLCYYFLCDYWHYFPRAERIYNRDLFFFLIAVLFIVNAVYTGHLAPDGGNYDKLLNRDQTEEWKGWMQVMFVWYHYYKAAETYNMIRIFIACYVWMTGFGNFSFYWIRKDFSLRRIFNSLFRLNFLVLLTCMVTNNPYMLYYICAMHTFWYLSVYAMMRPFHQYNENPKVMGFKFLVYFLIVFIIFDVPGVATTLFRPFGCVLNFKDSIHEWVFRSTLDHYATLFGMLCAYFHPNTEAFLRRINASSKSHLIITSISIVVFGVNYIWYKNVFVLNKFAYNKLHPYTFFIPMLSYIFLRNSYPLLRRWHCGLFGYLGKITLETYISQLHIYLIQDAKGLLVYFKGYPMLNFLLNSVIYVFMSNVLFKATLSLNAYIFPADYHKMLKNITKIFVGFLVAYMLVAVLSFI